MELNPDLYLVLRSRMIRAITPLPLECMVCTRPVHGAHRAVHGVHRASAWCSQGQCMVLTWPVHGAHRASAWCPQGQCMVLTGPVHGVHKASAWCVQGQCMVLTGSVHGAHRASFASFAINTTTYHPYSTSVSYVTLSQQVLCVNSRF